MTRTILFVIALVGVLSLSFLSVSSLAAPKDDATAWVQSFSLQYQLNETTTAEECVTYTGSDLLIIQNINGGMDQQGADNPQFRVTIDNPAQIYFFPVKTAVGERTTLIQQHFVQEQFLAYAIPGAEICVQAVVFSPLNFTNSFPVTLTGTIDRKISPP